MKNSEILWKIVEKNNVKYVFGLPGSEAIPILAFKPASIKWINIGNELDNSFVAQSFGFFSNNVGVVISSEGPGITTSLSGLLNATHEKMPLVIISILNKNVGFRKFNILSVSKTVTKYTIVIRDNDDFQTKMECAFYIAKTINTGVSVIIESNVPVLNSPYNDSVIKFSKLFHFDEPNKIIKKIHTNLNNTDTLIVVGYMHHIDYRILKNFFKTNNVPFVLTWKERSMVTNENNCGLIGSLGNHSANYAIYHAKNIIIFGNISSRLNNKFNSAFSLDYKIKKENIYSIVTDKTDAIKHSTFVMTTDDFNYIFSHLTLAVPSPFLHKLNSSNSILRTLLPPVSDLEKFSYVSCLVYKNKKLGIPVVTGVGNHWCAVGKYFFSEKPDNWLSSTEWASIGAGYYYGIGAHFATKKPVWIFEGDGGTAFAGTSLLYLINNQHLPITVIQFRNTLYSSILSAFDMLNLTDNPQTKEDVTETPQIDTNIFPNCHHFYNFKDYVEYLSKYPTSNCVRFIILHIRKNKPKNNYIYGINIHDKHYLSLIKNNDVEAISKYKSVPYDYQ